MQYYLDIRTSVIEANSITKHLTCLVIEANTICLNTQTKCSVIKAANQQVFGYRGVQLLKWGFGHFDS